MREVLSRLCSAVRYLHAAQSKLIAVLRPTHDRRLVSEAASLSEAGADELQAAREELNTFTPEAKAA